MSDGTQDFLRTINTSAFAEGNWAYSSFPDMLT